MRPVWLIGERANDTEDRPRWRGEELSLGWRFRMGAFREGPSRERLIGLVGSGGQWWDQSVNLLPAVPTRDATWGSRDRELAKRVARLIREEADTRGARLVVCGIRAAWALGIKPSVAGTYLIRDSRNLVIPHPSGANRIWNNRDVVRLVSNAIKQHIKQESACSRP